MNWRSLASVAVHKSPMIWDSSVISLAIDKTPSLNSVCDVRTCENVQGGEHAMEKHSQDQVSSSSIAFVELA